jgi:hypothetical protein
MEKAFSGIRRAFEKPKIDFPWGSNKTRFIRYLSTSVVAAEFLSGVEEQQRVLLNFVSAGRTRIVKREFHSFARNRRPGVRLIRQPERGAFMRTPKSNCDKISRPSLQPVA